MKNLKTYAVGLLAAGIVTVAFAQSSLLQSAYFLTGAQGSVVQYTGYAQGQPILGPALGQAVLKGTLVTTAAATNNVTITGVTATSNCVISASNAAGAVAGTFISSVSTNTVVVGHAVTAAMNYNIHCTQN